MMNKIRIMPTVFFICILTAILIFIIYTARYYRADAHAIEVLNSDSDNVIITGTDYGWLFDGPSEDSALVFYPGGKVEESAYAPRLHRIAAGTMDVCLVKMPFRLAFFAIDAAGEVM